jgi:high-affinity iron transporter
MLNTRYFASALVLLAMTLAPTGPALAQSVSADAQRLDHVADEVLDAATASDWATARTEWAEFRATWREAEDGVRDASRDSYTRIETNMRQVNGALSAEPPDAAAVTSGAAAIRTELAPLLSGTASSNAPAPSGTASLSTLLASIDRGITAIGQQDVTTARAAVEQVRDEWVQVETDVKARDPQAYRTSEDRMAEAASALSASPPRTDEALGSLTAMRTDLAPLAEQPARYGMLDAAVILLREGLEALLVVAALLAFLAKAGHQDKQGWIWGGAGVGVLLSVALAFVIQSLFSTAVGGTSRELLEGITGLLAAAMLVYVSYWLHSRSSLKAWQAYVRDRTAAALAGGGMFSLGLISFLAVFREGAETSLFYIGIASSIALTDLALGVGLGAAGLVLIGVAMLVFGMRIPIRPFFLISSLLLYYLAFKFIGTGLHSLQVAGVLPATPAALPAWEVVGLFPTWETTLPQLGLLALAGVVLLWSRSYARAPSHQA